MSLHRLRDTIAIVALLLIGLSVPGVGRQARRMSGFQQDVSTCISQQFPPDARVAACNSVIAAGRFDGTKLAGILDFRGMAYGTKGDYDRAITDFNEAMRIDPTLAQSFLSRGTAYQLQGKLDQALADFAEAQRLAPNDPAVANALAAARAQQKPAAGTAQAERPPDVPNANLADQTILTNDMRACTTPQASLDTIIAACTRVIGLNRFNGMQLAILLGSRANAYSAETDYGRAIADYTEISRLVPINAPTYYNRGLAYQNLGDLKSALADFLEFRRLAPDNPLGPDRVAEVQRMLAAAAEQARSMAEKSSAEIAVLQHRLSDDGCYRGAIDGRQSQALTDAVKACPSQDPILRIETGTHIAAVRAIGADAQCRILATTSDDKTTRVWSAADGRLLRTIRWPIDAEGDGGKGRAVAVSPDGRYVAAAGSDPQWAVTRREFVYVFDAATGAMVARPFGSTNVIRGLAFSPDGRWLAAVGGTGQSGVRVYSTADWRLAMTDLSYHQQDIYAVAFGPDGSLYVAGYDRTLRRYGSGPSFPSERTVELQGGSEPLSIAADPRGQFVAVGFIDSRRISLFDARTLRADMRGAGTRGVDKGNLGAVAWSTDGGRLFAGGRYEVYLRRLLVMFDRNGRRLGRTASGPEDTIYDLTSCGSGMETAAGSGFGSFDATGTFLWHASAAGDMVVNIGDVFTIAPNAKQIRFALGSHAGASPADYSIADPVMFDLTRGTLSGAPQPIPGFVAPDTTTLPVDHWYNEPNTSFAGRSLGLGKDEVAHALAIQQRRDGFVLGTRSYLRAYAQDGSSRWEVESPAETWGVNLSSDGQIIVAAVSDGTIRWHRWSDGQELLALFVDRQTKRWVAWTPKGYYMASPGGEDLIGWHVNRGWDQAADFFPASRFRARFNRPDIVRLVLDALDEDQAIKQANAAAGSKEDTQPLIGQLPPLIRILDPGPGTHVASGAVTIGYSFRSPSGLPVDRIVVDVNGRPVKEIGLPVRTLSGNDEVKGTVAVALGTRESDVGLIAWSGDLTSQVAHVTLTWDGAPATTSAMRKLHVLVAGVSAYTDPDMRLDFAAKDAADFAKALEAQKGVYYGDVETRVLTDGEVTRASLTQALDWLKTVATGPDDVSILFLAGHGLTDAKGAYWFFPADADADDMERKGLSQEEIRRSLQGLKGKVLWFLDTCHAGAAAKRPPADMNLLLNTVTAAENGGIVVFASSSGTQVSIESKDLGNGAFTKALVEGIEQGKAAFLHDLVTTSSLDGFVESRVKELTGDKQTPVMERPPQEPDFTIAQAPR